jgi:hypothetical protein
VIHSSRSFIASLVASSARLRIFMLDSIRRRQAGLLGQPRGPGLGSGRFHLFTIGLLSLNHHDAPVVLVRASPGTGVPGLARLS